MKKHLCLRASIVVLLFLLGIFQATSALSLEFSLSGSEAKSHLGKSLVSRETYTSSISFSLTQLIQVGIGYTRQFSVDEGYSLIATVDDPESPGTPVYVYQSYENKTVLSAYSSDVTFIIYPGDVFVPFIFFGGVVKEYSIKYVQGQNIAEDDLYMPLDGQGGIGMSIKLNQSFSLKITTTYSKGKKTVGVLDTDGSGNVASFQTEDAWDRTTQIGISYRI
ncbi:MAG: hypothetical protein KBD78_16150 [Oligoflexales bacterium]|nr:hypothetical protein [Oligoflexales bacterium]